MIAGYYPDVIGITESCATENDVKRLSHTWERSCTDKVVTGVLL